MGLTRREARESIVMGREGCAGTLARGHARSGGAAGSALGRGIVSTGNDHAPAVPVPVPA